MSERAGNFAVDLMCRVAGRRNVIRAARFTLRRARPDFSENMRINSRIALQAWVLDIMPRGRPVHVVDAGANVGDWSRAFLALAESRGRLDDVDLHALEPSTEPFRQLTKTLGNSAASVHQLALSDHPGEMTLHITRENSRLTSTHEVPGLHTADENVAMTTLDAYAQQANLSRIDLLSVDTAGNDVAVLKGASGLLREQRIAVILLDHNELWVYAGLFLRDAFRLLEPLGYRLGRLGPEGIDFCKHYNSSLETFAAKMFVACTKDAAKRLPHGSGLPFVPSTATSYWL